MQTRLSRRTSVPDGSSRAVDNAALGAVPFSALPGIFAASGLLTTRHGAIPVSA
jgi:hypothetical protein